MESFTIKSKCVNKCEQNFQIWHFTNIRSMKVSSSFAERQMDMMRPAALVHFPQSPRTVSENWEFFFFLYTVIREVFWLGQRISKNGSLSYSMYRGEEMCWSSVNEISQNMTFNLRTEGIQFSKQCGLFRMPYGRRSPKLSYVECNTPLSELFRKCASVTFWGPMADVVRWYHVPISCQSQFK